jgi:xanthine dehydrogenase YagS FAD-binding subunit
MAVIRDVMPVFELYQPASIDDAIKLLDKHGADALVLAGGLDSMDWLKDRLKKPQAVVDLGAIKELRGVKELNGGLEIGAMTPLTEVVAHPVVREKYSILMDRGGARRLAADPQSGHRRRQRVAGHALLVLPRRLELLPGGRQHLLRRHARPPSTASTRSSTPTAASP